MGIMVPDGLEDAMYPPASRTKEQVDLYTEFTKFFYREELGGMGVDMRSCPDAYAGLSGRCGGEGWPFTWEHLCLNGEDW